MIDPVNNFKIPEDWIKRSRIQYNELKSMIESGCFVLLSDGSLLRRGYTTGTTASAAAKAAVLSLEKDVSEVSVPTPCGIRVLLSVNARKGKASVFKNSGDHGFDVTGGAEITAEAKENDRTVIIAGYGIGSKNNRPAINSSPMQQIEHSIKEALDETGSKGAAVTISIPEGVELARKTLNEKIGIKGGLSILGTTGFVEPWNEHLGEMKEEMLRKADRVVLTTGRTGMRFSSMMFPHHEVILIGSDISRGIAAAKGEVIICGLPGLILKWAKPDILEKTRYFTIQEMIENDPENQNIDISLNEAVKLYRKRIILLNRNGTILRDTEKMFIIGGV